MSRILVILMTFVTAVFLISVDGETKTASETLTEAKTLFDSGNHTEALKLYDEIINKWKSYKEGQEALYRKGLCLHPQKKFEEAISCWKDLLQKYHSTAWDDDATLDIGRTYAFSLNQPDLALKYYEEFFKKLKGECNEKDICFDSDCSGCLFDARNF